MGILNQDQFRRLADALGTAFDFFTLNTLVATRINRQGLAHYAPMVAPFEFQAVALAQRAETDDFTDHLILAARELRPANKSFLALAHELGLTAFGKPTDKYGHLEALVRKSNRFHDLAIWRTRLTDIESRVCRIELRGTHDGVPARSTGTGFLIATDLVLTNYHVIEPLLHSVNGFTATPTDVTVRFDFKRLRENVVHPGDEYRLAQQWDVDHSPYEQNELPTNDELDYAVIRLHSAAGNDIVAGWTGVPNAPRRGWFDLCGLKPELTAGAPLIIVQYPDKEPLQIAYDTDSIIGLNANGTRVHYRTNTLGGSSGAPGFDAALDLVALHHAGDPYWRPSYNAGIPIQRIADRLCDRRIIGKP